MVLSCEDVSLGYEGKPVVEHLNFRLEQGDYLCILGENGSGKSTLLCDFPLLFVIEWTHATFRQEP